jgi:hypothetical protein
MQEDEFEKQVQMKMDQLAFDPSDTVWANVDRAVNKDKNRRKPLFWLFFLAVPIVIGTGYFYFTNGHSGIPVTIKPSATTEAGLPQQTAGARASVAGLKENTSVDKSKPVSGRLTGSGQRKSLNTESNGETRESGSAQVEKNSTHAETIIAEDSLNNGNQGAEKKSGPDSVSKAVSSKMQMKKTSSWAIGFSGIVGFSEANLNYNSAVQSGLAFSLGGFVSKAISSRFSVSAGLNYHYYSTKISIGDAAGTSGNIYYSPVQLNSAGYIVNTGSRSYTNQYHFIELPVLADIKLNKSKKLPVIWQGGFSFSYLVSTDAMYYDPSANVYYKNMQLFNQVQWSAATAVLIGFNVNNNQLLLGPQVQYGISGLQKNTAAGQQHLLSYGLKISFVPHKK